MWERWGGTFCCSKLPSRWGKGRGLLLLTSNQDAVQPARTRVEGGTDAAFPLGEAALLAMSQAVSNLRFPVPGSQDWDEPVFAYLSQPNEVFFWGFSPMSEGKRLQAGKSRGGSWSAEESLGSFG